MQQRAAGTKKTALFDLVNRKWRVAHRPAVRSSACASAATCSVPAERATERARRSAPAPATASCIFPVIYRSGLHAGRGTRGRCGRSRRRRPWLPLRRAAQLAGEERLRGLGGVGLGARVGVEALALAAGVVEVVGGAGIERERDVAAARAAALDEPPADFRRNLLVGVALEAARSPRLICAFPLVASSAPAAASAAACTPCLRASCRRDR